VKLAHKHPTCKILFDIVCVSDKVYGKPSLSVNYPVEVIIILKE